MSSPSNGRDTVMFVTGLVMALAAATAMLTGTEDTNSFVTLGMVGIVFIAAARRPRSHV